jgi:hypothetical protein
MFIASDRILRSAMASKLAYAPDTKASLKFPLQRQLHTNEQSTQIVQIIDCGKTGAHAYVWNTGQNSKLIAFRGSHRFGDICKFMKTEKQDFSFCQNKLKVHNVVYEMFASIEPYLTDLMFKENGMTQKQYFTLCGHSAGGALAMFATAYYCSMTNKRHEFACHTFGSPKIGDNDFNQWFIEYVNEAVNLKNKCDIVPCFPFSGYEDLPCTYEMERTTNNIVKDHDLETYIDNIRSAIELSKI